MASTIFSMPRQKRAVRYAGLCPAPWGGGGPRAPPPPGRVGLPGIRHQKPGIGIVVFDR
jgi:hypothetical protein